MKKNLHNPEGKVAVIVVVAALVVLAALAVSIRVGILPNPMVREVAVTEVIPPAEKMAAEEPAEMDGATEDEGAPKEGDEIAGSEADELDAVVPESSEEAEPALPAPEGSEEVFVPGCDEVFSAFDALEGDEAKAEHLNSMSDSERSVAIDCFRQKALQEAQTSAPAGDSDTLSEEAGGVAPVQVDCDAVFAEFDALGTDAEKAAKLNAMSDSERSAAIDCFRQRALEEAASGAGAPAEGGVDEPALPPEEAGEAVQVAPSVDCDAVFAEFDALGTDEEKAAKLNAMSDSDRSATIDCFRQRALEEAAGG